MSDTQEIMNEEEKRPRGRPRKHPLPSVSMVVAAVKRGRGRPRKHVVADSDKEKETVDSHGTSDSGDDHFLMHVRKVFTDKHHHVPFKDGRAHRISQSTAARVLSAHDNIKRSEDKLAFVHHASMSLSHMNHVTKHGVPKTEPKDPKKTLPS